MWGSRRARERITGTESENSSREEIQKAPEEGLDLEAQSPSVLGQNLSSQNSHPPRSSEHDLFADIVH